MNKVPRNSIHEENLNHPLVMYVIAEIIKCLHNLQCVCCIFMNRDLQEADRAIILILTQNTTVNCIILTVVLYLWITV